MARLLHTGQVIVDLAMALDTLPVPVAMSWPMTPVFTQAVASM